MEFQELVSRLALAIGAGLLIGLERAWRTRQDSPGSRTAGIRTFALTGLLGGVVGALGQSMGGAGGGIAVGLAFAAYGAVMAAFCLEENRAEKGFSATTWVAAILTFGLGALAVIGDRHAVAALAVIAAIILATREPLHAWIAKLTWPELRSALVLLAMTFVALPIMPDEPIGPFGGVNPREVWIIAIVLAAVSFLGYAAVKYLGATHGVLLAGAAGGLASSTAVTVANARRAAAGEGTTRLLAAGVAMASAVMFVRVVVIAFAINRSLLVLLAPPLLAASAVAVAFALVATYWRRSDAAQPKEIKFRNPFAFWTVIGFALLLGVVMLLARAIGESAGASGTILGAAIAGLADVDAVTVAVARLAPQPLVLRDAAIAILTAVVTDTISKIGIGAAIGRGRFAFEISIMALLCFLAGGVALWATWVLAIP